MEQGPQRAGSREQELGGKDHREQGAGSKDHREQGAGRRMDGEASVLRESLGFLPVFLLHMSSGMMGSFTTILIHYFEHSHPDLKDYTTLLGTSEDYAQIIIAVFGGFLQQVIGPRRMLQLATLPAVTSWLLILLGSHSVMALILSRVSAGVSMGLLATNVYMVDVASTRNIVFFNYMRQVFITLGAILMYATVQITYKVLEVEFRLLAAAVIWLPVAALLALLCMPESPVYLERRKRLEDEAGDKTSPLALQLDKLKFPATSPTVYIPLGLISCLISLQHFSGFTYTKRFLLQVLTTATNNNTVTTNTTNTDMTNTNMTSMGVEEPLNTDCYYWGMLVCLVYLLSSLLVAKLLQSIRRRFMYFVSLVLTSLCLLVIGFLIEKSMVSVFLSQDKILFLKVFFLCLHVFVVQCGLQGLPGQLTDILFPSSCKSIMKGVCRAVTSLTLVIFIFLINSFPDYCRFWIMSVTLLCASPVLFIFIPEIRNIGKSTAGNFILPVQTVFYILLPRIDARKKWKSMVKKVSIMKAFTNLLDKKMAQEEALSNCTTFVPTFTFDGEMVDLEEFKTNPELRRKNCELVAYISNILPHSGFLDQHRREDRILVGRGPTRFQLDGEARESGGIFLFDDVLIVAKCLLRNWRYVKESSFQVAWLTVTREGSSLLVQGREDRVRIAFSDQTEAETWRKYIEFCQTSMEPQKQSLLVQSMKKLSSAGQGQGINSLSVRLLDRSQGQEVVGEEQGLERDQEAVQEEVGEAQGLLPVKATLLQSVLLLGKNEEQGSLQGLETDQGALQDQPGEAQGELLQVKHTQSLLLQSVRLLRKTQEKGGLTVQNLQELGKRQSLQEIDNGHKLHQEIGKGHNLQEQGRGLSLQETGETQGLLEQDTLVPEEPV